MTRVLGGVSFFGGSTVCTVFKESEDTLVEPATEGARTEILRLLTLPGMDVVILETGGTGVAFGDLVGVFLIVVVPLALDEALGFKVMVKVERAIGICRTTLHINYTKLTPRNP